MSKLLNEEQKTIIESELGIPILVSAGPGAGKTFVSVERIKKIVQEENCKDILILSFTNTAKGAISRQLHDNKIFVETQDLENKVLTFHSFGRHYSQLFLKHKYGKRNFKLVTENKINSIIKSFCFEENEVLDWNPSMNREIVQLIKNINLKCHLPDCSEESLNSETKDQLKKYIETYIKNTLHIQKIQVDKVIELHEKYVKWKNKEGVFDFEDDLMGCLQYFYLKPKQSQALALTKYKFIFVDEFQDTNNVQFAIVYELAKHHNNVFCVGDPRQSIFGFSGSTPKVFDKFIEKFPNAKVLSLTQNYRSTADIIKIANDFSKQKNQLLIEQKDLFTNKTEHGTIRFFCANSQKGELQYILKNCTNLIAQNPKIRIIILFRSKIEKKHLVKFLNQNKIKFEDLKKETFEQTAELFLIIAACKHAMLHLSENNDYSYLKSFTTAPQFNLLKKDLEKFLEYQTKNNLSLLQTYREYQNIEGLSENGIQKIKLANDLIQKMESCEKMPIHELIRYAFKMSGYENSWKVSDSSSAYWKLENVEKFINRIEELVDEYQDANYDEIIKQSLQKHINNNSDKVEDKNILISTIHSVKGREYDAVFLYALWKDALPSEASKNSENIYLEEVNLTYVAITRARRFLFLTTHKNNKTEPSDFYFELEKIWEIAAEKMGIKIFKEEPDPIPPNEDTHTKKRNKRKSRNFEEENREPYPMVEVERITLDEANEPAFMRTIHTISQKQKSTRKKSSTSKTDKKQTTTKDKKIKTEESFTKQTNETKNMFQKIKNFFWKK